MSEETKTEQGTGGLQRPPQSRSSQSQIAEREEIKAELQRQRRAAKEGHTTGGYCITENLHKVERKLHAILATELEEAEAQYANPKHPTIVTLKREIAGLSWKPRLVVAQD